MSGLLALFDDVAAIAKVAASSIDDIVGAAAKSGAKAAGVVIDDAAVTPRYAQGFAADRELPIIWRISLGSLRNKLLILLPAALILSQFLPGAITPLLMVGGLYLCFEGAEKLFHAIFPQGHAEVGEDFDVKDPSHLEEEKVAGAIKTDFVLSAEIMTIALAAIPESALWMEAVTLAIVGVGITLLVYGSVALIVKMDDIGLFLARRARLAVTRAFGRGLVLGMPKLMRLLSAVGTAAMLWVGGSIVMHGAEVLGWGWPAHTIDTVAKAVASMIPPAEAAVHWIVTAAIDFMIGTVLGFMLIPLATRIALPLWERVMAKAKGAH